MASQKTDDGSGMTRLAMLRRAATFSITFERLWAASWPALMVLALFVAASLFGLWGHLPTILHVLGLAAFSAAFAVAVYRGFRIFHSLPSASPMSRLERDSGIEAHSLDSLDDAIASDGDDRLTRALWKRERARANRLASQLRVSPPRSLLPVRDPWALRAAMLLVLVVAWVEGGNQAVSRLAQSIDFNKSAQAQAAIDPSARLWITPPGYTGLAPFQVDSAPPATTQTAATDETSKEPQLPAISAAVPVGSTALVQVQNLPSGNEGYLNATMDGANLDWTALGTNGAEIRSELQSSGDLRIIGGSDEIAAWSIDIIDDEFPAIGFASEPTQTQRGVLKVDFEASDDYGITDIQLRIETEFMDEPFRVVVSKPRGGSTTMDTSRYLDLTANKLAGLPVTMTLEATDAIGQIGQSDTIEAILPERPFTHPLAIAIIEARKRLVANPNQIYDIANIIRRLGDSPDAQSFGTVVPLALGMAASRIYIERTSEGRESAIQLLWETALYVEDGALSISERQLRELQERLAQALENGAELDELERMLAELQDAMNEFLDEMMRQALEQQRQADPNQTPQELPPNAQMVDRQDLQDMLDQIREMLQQGMRDEAMEMMAQLQEMLENMQTAMNQQMEPSPGEQALSDLQQMIQAQQNLLDRTHNMDQGQADGSQQDGEDVREGPQSMPGMAAEQDVLRHALGELMRRLGEAGMPIPRSLGQAELQMRESRNALENQQPGDATGPQSNAIDMMQQGGQALLDELREQLANQPGQGMGQPNQAAQRQGRDPLGRNRRNDGGASEFGTEVPDQNDLGRARGVLEELQRRSGERNRPSRELDYIQRLLDRF